MSVKSLNNQFSLRYLPNGMRLLTRIFDGSKSNVSPATIESAMKHAHFILDFQTSCESCEEMEPATAVYFNGYDYHCLGCLAKTNNFDKETIEFLLTVQRLEQLNFYMLRSAELRKELGLKEQV